MLLGTTCSIYANRPQACRVYDCRVFAACGEETDALGKDPIATQVRRWEFQFNSCEDTAAYRAVEAAARYLACEQYELADEFGEIGPARRSVLAIELHRLFWDQASGDSQPAVTVPSLDAVKTQLRNRLGGLRP
jgi:hypothetical protein